MRCRWIQVLAEEELFPTPSRIHQRHHTFNMLVQITSSTQLESLLRTFKIVVVDCKCSGFLMLSQISRLVLAIGSLSSTLCISYTFVSSSSQALLMLFSSSFFARTRFSSLSSTLLSFSRVPLLSVLSSSYNLPKPVSPPWRSSSSAPSLLYFSPCLLFPSLSYLLVTLTPLEFTPTGAVHARRLPPSMNNSLPNTTHHAPSSWPK